MWKTIEYFKNGLPKTEVNEQGSVYSYVWKKLLNSRNFYVEIAKAFPEICGEWFEGCHVHHKDGNRSNNAPSNLICLSPQEHHRIHNESTPEVIMNKSAKEAAALSEKAVRFYCRCSKQMDSGKHKGKAPVEMAYYYKGKRMFMNTGEYRNPKNFNSLKFKLSFLVQH